MDRLLLNPPMAGAGAGHRNPLNPRFGNLEVLADDRAEEEAEDDDLFLTTSVAA